MIALIDQLPMRADRAMLRLLRESDVSVFHEYRADPLLARYQGWSPMSLMQASEFVRGMSKVSDLIAGDWIQLAIADPTSDVLIGDVGIFLDVERNAAEIGFTVRSENQGRGIASAAVGAAIRLIFTSSLAEKIRATTDARNVASIAVLERSGFTKTARREAEFKGECCIEFDYELPRVTAFEKSRNT